MALPQQIRVSLNVNTIISAVGTAFTIGCFIFLREMNDFKVRTTEIDSRQDISITELKQDSKDKGAKDNQQDYDISQLNGILPNGIKISKYKK